MFPASHRSPTSRHAVRRRVVPHQARSQQRLPALAPAGVLPNEDLPPERRPQRRHLRQHAQEGLDGGGDAHARPAGKPTLRFSRGGRVRVPFFGFCLA